MDPLSESEQISVCRGCLALDRPVYSLKDLEFEEDFYEIIGGKNFLPEDLVVVMCTNCLKLLMKCCKFRDQCREVDKWLAALHYHGQHISLEEIDTLRGKYDDKLKLSIAETLIIDIQPIDTNLNTATDKVSHIVDKSDDLELKDESQDSVDYIDDAIDDKDDSIQNIDDPTDNKDESMDNIDDSMDNIDDSMDNIDDSMDNIDDDDDDYETEHTIRKKTFTETNCSKKIVIENGMLCITPLENLHSNEKKMNTAKTVKPKAKYDSNNDNVSKINFEKDGEKDLNELYEELEHLTDEVLKLDDNISESESDNESKPLSKSREVYNRVDELTAIIDLKTKPLKRRRKWNAQAKRIIVYTEKNTTKKMDTKKKIDTENPKIDCIEEFEKKFNTVRITLTYEEQVKEIKDRENSESYKNSLYKCDQCFKTFSREKIAVRHKQTHADRPYQCNICRKTFTLRRFLVHHMKKHIYRYECKLCMKRVETSSQARKHHMWHKGKTYICEHCSKVFNHSTTYANHLRLNHQDQHQFVCQVCVTGFRTAVGLQKHLKLGYCKTPAAPPVCEKCRVRFNNPEALRTHAAGGDCSQLQMWSCRQCGENYQELSAYHLHRVTHRKKRAPYTAAEGKSTQCDKCSREFKSHHALLLHRSFRHGDANSVTRRYMCETCGKTYHNPSWLVVHQRSHTGERPFKCLDCGKAYTHLSVLKVHRRTHTGERPFACEVCPKSFYSLTALARHKLVHTGEKPYSCPNCTKTFSQSNSMKMHVRTVHLKLPTPYKSQARRNRQAIVANGRLRSQDKPEPFSLSINLTGSEWDR